MAKRILETAKTLLIILLVITLLGLVLITWVYDIHISENESFTWAIGIAKRLGMNVDSAPEANILIGSGFVPVALPTKIAVTAQPGVHHGVQFDDKAVQTVYNKILPCLEDAVVSMRQPYETTHEAWINALRNRNVYLSYPGHVPLSVLGVWLGGGADFPIQVQAIVISTHNEHVVLYFRDNGKYYRSETNIPSPEWDGSGLPEIRFAFETDWASSAALAPDNLISGGKLLIPKLHMSRPSDISSVENSILLAFDFRGGAYYNYYIEKDGTKVFVDNTRTLRFFTDGTVIYRSPSASDNPPVERTLAEYVELAAEVARPAAAASQSGQLQLVSAVEREDMVFVTFGLTIEGCPVLYPDSAQMTQVVFQNGRLIRAYCRVLQYEVLGEFGTPLPQRQALQLYTAQPEGVWPALYSEGFYRAGRRPPEKSQTPPENSSMTICYMLESSDKLSGTWYFIN